MKSDPRDVALSILNTLETGRRTLDVIVEEALGKAAFSHRRDRALVITLVYGVLRWRNTLDWLIRQFSNTPFKRITPGVRNILRLALFQIRFLDRVPDYAAVNAAVDMTKTSAAPRLSGFVNGVLRAAVRRHRQVVLSDAAAGDTAPLAVTASLPEWLLRRWIERYGFSKTKTMCDVINTVPPLTVRVNSLKTSFARAREALADEVSDLSPGRYSPCALSFYAPEAPVNELSAFRQGWCRVQDEAAQLAGFLLDPRPEETILDACAGRGGKTAHIAQLMGNRGHILAVDKNARKLDLLETEMVRQGVLNVKTAKVNLLQNFLPFPDHFDRVLADCPCSGLGVLRKNPDTKWSVSPEDLSRHHDHQVRLLDRLAQLVRPGGILLYVVCSREPEENEAVVNDFLNIHGEFDIERRAGADDNPAFRFLNRDGFFQTGVYPDGLDGFFGARLKKKP